jgi:hypothetical protein
MVMHLSVTLREERRLRVFENRVLRRTFEFMKEELMGDWRRLHNEDDQVKEDEIGEHATRMREREREREMRTKSWSET